MPAHKLAVVGGVDTHKDLHVAAVVDSAGRVLGTASFAARAAGYEQLHAWMASFGELDKVGVEGTGSYGAGLTRHLRSRAVRVVEVDRPDRRARRRRGKSDTVDAETAARAALSGEADVVPKARDGVVESVRAIRVAYCSARDARTRVANQLRDLVLTAPEELRAVLSPLEAAERAARCAELQPPNGPAGPLAGLYLALGSLGRRYGALSTELGELEALLDRFTAEANPALRGLKGVGPVTAATLLVAAGDNPERLANDAAFAALCGAAPIEASSGKVVRRRLNRGGNRQANHALWTVVMVRLACDRPTRAYAARRRAEGKSQREIVRCLKRYVAREVYRQLVAPHQVPAAADLRLARLRLGLPLTAVAERLGASVTQLSRLERAVVHDAVLARRYTAFLAATPLLTDDMSPTQVA